MSVPSARRILLTRSAEDNAEWARRLAELGFEPAVLDCLECESLAVSAEELARALAGCDWLALGSRRAVDALAALHPDPLPSIALAAVGPATGARARERFGRCELEGAAGTARALALELARREPARVLVAGAKERTGELERGLAARGIAYETLALYRTRPVEPPGSGRHGRALALVGLDAVLVASPSALRGLLAQVEPAALRALPLITLGPTTSAAVRAADLRVAAESRTRDLEGLVEALRGVFSTARTTDPSDPRGTR